MIIQSKKVWIADQFMPAQVEMDGGKITGIYAYGTKEADVDYGTKRVLPVSLMSTATAPIPSTPMTPMKKACATGPRVSLQKALPLSWLPPSPRAKKF